ncbi:MULTISPECIES: CBS domain-containing protein [Gammaproteobacteria]|uniref:CBS domain-containing protein n=1 Tax=Gammaproteobacteria TaxID=1236 RepID=UPI001AD9F572|nr:CBS domain-containing protein [Salinisphaera sp. G21_0]MBO9493278.1 CBS domain-containing protein [Thalassotalea sp. G20_0]
MRSITVEDCMTPKVVTVSPDIQVAEAIRILLQHNITAAPVVDNEGTLIGILSESDCLEGTLNGSYFSQDAGLVRDYMTSQVVTADPQEDIITVYQRFMTDKAHRVPVVADGNLVGILSPKDLMSAVLEFYEHPVDSA